MATTIMHDLLCTSPTCPEQRSLNRNAFENPKALRDAIAGAVCTQCGSSMKQIATRATKLEDADVDE